jgi:hypothetical protein
VFALTRALLLDETVSQEALAQAVFVSARTGVCLLRALLSTPGVDPVRLERHLARSGEPLYERFAPSSELVESLPAGLCERLLAVPVRRDPETGLVDVAVVDARDPHSLAEVGYWLQAPTRPMRVSLTAMCRALTALAPPVGHGLRSLAPPILPSAGPVTPHSGESPLAASPDVESSGGELPAPVTVRGPFFGELPASEAPEVHAIRGVETRDGILEALVEGARLVARRVGVFAVRRDGLVGWTCSPELADLTAFRSLRWSPSTRTVLRTALESSSQTPTVCFVTLPEDAVHGALRAMLGPERPHEVALAPVTVEGKGVALLLAEELDDVVVASERLAELARAAGEALELALLDPHEQPR